MSPSSAARSLRQGAWGRGRRLPGSPSAASRPQDTNAIVAQPGRRDRVRGESRVPCRAGGRLLRDCSARGGTPLTVGLTLPPAARGVCAATLGPGHLHEGEQALDRPAAAAAFAWKEKPCERRRVRRGAATRVTSRQLIGQPCIRGRTSILELALRVSECADGREGNTVWAAGVTGRLVAGERGAAVRSRLLPLGCWRGFRDLGLVGLG